MACTVAQRDPGGRITHAPLNVSQRGGSERPLTFWDCQICLHERQINVNSARASHRAGTRPMASRYPVEGTHFGLRCLPFQVADGGPWRARGGS